MSSQYTLDHGTGIYTIENLVTGADYLGGTAKSFHVRWKRHRQELRAGWHASKGLQRDWRKYGESAFAFTVIERIEDPDELWAREKHWINMRFQYCTPAENYNNIMHKSQGSSQAQIASELGTSADTVRRALALAATAETIEQEQAQLTEQGAIS